MKKQNNNNNNVLTIISVCLIALLAIIGIYKLYGKTTPEDPKKVENKAINLGMKQDNIIENGNNSLLLTSYEQYIEYFDNDKVKEEDFKNNNYVLVQVNYDECSESDVKLKDYSIKDNKIIINFTYKASCGVCAPQYIYYLIEVDKKETDYQVETNYKAINKTNCPKDVAYKPMIYLYPDKVENIKVKLGREELITSSYPKYEKEWDVKAYPSGKLIDNKTGRELYGLYWKGNGHKAKREKDGFVIKGEETIEFLEEKLEVLGLNEREADEFIIYWLPRLENNKYNYIRFETMEEIDSYMPLEISPKPNSVIRILMNFKALDKKIKVKEQELVTPSRTGFTVVEWGGSIIE